MSKRELTAGKTENTSGKKRKRTIAAWIIASAAMVFFALYLAGKAFLTTPYAAGWVSDYLSRSLQQRVTVAGLALSGVTVSVQGITVSNPEGFSGGALLSAGSLRITPNMPGILTGKRRLTLLQVEGLKINLGKNTAGEWNFRPLVRYLTRKKERPAAEIFVKHLVLRDASLKIHDFALGKIGLTVNDFSTKGLVDSKLIFTGTDEKGNPFRLTAEGRLGKDPDIRLSLDASRISLRALRDVMKAKPFLNLEKGTARLSLFAHYRSGEVVAKGRTAFDHVGVVVKQHSAPLRGGLDFAARYNTIRDEAVLESSSFVINDAIRLDASGTVRQVKGEKKFRVGISCNEIRLKELLAFLPKETVRDISLNGSMTCKDLQLGGSRIKGITSGGGKLFLRNGAAAKGGRTLFQGLSSDVVISRAAYGWNMGGKLSMNTSVAKVPLDGLEARFTARFSDIFKPLSLEIPALKAGLMGVPVRGELTYAPKERNPYRGMLYVKGAPLSALNDLVGRNNISFSSGKADISLQAVGRGPAAFTGEMRARLSGLNGMVLGKNCILREGEITSRFSSSGGKVNAGGTVSVEGGVYSGKNLSGSSVYSLAGGKFSLTGGKAVFNRTGILFADISGRLPMREVTPTGTSYPLVFTVKGLDVAAGETRAGDISGSMEGVFAVDAGGRRLEGNTTLNIPALSWRRQPVGSVKAHVVLAGERTVAKMNGTILDGTFSSVVRLDPFFPKKGVSFMGSLQNAQAVKLSGMLPERFMIRVPSGKITTNLEGSWSADEGFRYGIEGVGNEVALATKEGKTLVTGAGLTLKADVAGTNVHVKEATIRQGQRVALKIAGSIANADSSTRDGKFSLELETTPVASLLDATVNLLPKPLQQAAGGGNLGMRGTLGIAGGKIFLDGSIKCDNVLFDFPSQKVSISGATGTLPFSVYLAGATVEKPVDTQSFSKTNYSALLDTLRRETQKTKNGDLLKIGKVQFGTLETGDIELRTKSGNGIVQVSSIESSLYSGTLIGRGFFFYDKGLRYGADILVNDMSLRQFCNSYPALRGYISGLLDGVISLYGGRGGLPAMVGFIDLWPHSGKREKMLVSKEFLQRLAGKKLKGFFFRDDRPYDHGEISAYLENGYLTFEKLDISHTNFLGMKDLSVSVAPVQNRIGLDHLFQAIREAAARGRPAAGEPSPEAPVQPDIKWLE